jgi:hypothetical protein
VEAFELAADGAEYVVSGAYRAASLQPGGWKNCNLRTQLLKLIRRAGLSPWPRLFHNLRASRETDLTQRFPIHVVCAWIGNTPRVALGHYLQTLDADFNRAVQGGAECGAPTARNAAQSGTGSKRQGPTDSQKPLENMAFGHPVTVSAAYCAFDHVGRVGVEPTSNPL